MSDESRISGVDSPPAPSMTISDWATSARKLGKKDVARGWLQEGLTRAQAKGDTHTAGELQQALDALG